VPDKFEDALLAREQAAAPPVPTGPDPFEAAMARRGLVELSTTETLQNTGDPLGQGVKAAKRGAIGGLGQLGDLADFSARTLFPAQLKESAMAAAAERERFDSETAFENPLQKQLRIIKALTTPPEGAPKFPGRKEALSAARAAGVNLDPKPRAEQTPSERAATVGGDVLGEGAAFVSTFGLGVPAALSRAELKGTTLLGKVGKSIGASFKKDPAKFTLTELGMLSGSAQGAAAAELLAPENGVARFFGEVGGGIINPTTFLVRAGPRLGAAAGNAARSFTEAGREASAAKILQKTVIEAGEDPKALAALLLAGDVENVALTAGRKTGSPALLRLEATIAKDDLKFLRTNTQMTGEAIRTIEGAIDNLVRSGSPEHLRMAAKLRDQHFGNLLENRLNRAMTAAQETSAKVTGSGRVGASLEAEKIMREALDGVRKVERSLWAKVPKDIPVAVGEPLQDAISAARRKLLQEELIPRQDSIFRIMEDGGSTTGELITLRSRLLDDARTARATGDRTKASVASDLAEGVRQQLDAVADSSLDEARAFTRQLHEKFTQTFAGEATRTTSQGGARIAPETLLDRAFAGGDSAGLVRFGELEQAARFADEAIGGGLFAGAVRNQEEAFLRSAAQDIIGPDGAVNPARLQSFVARNQETLNQFPALKADLADVQSATNAVRAAEAGAKNASRIVKNRAVFKRLIGFEDPTTVINKIISGPEPMRDIAQLARMSRKSGKAATDGLQTSIMDSLINNATSADGVVDFTKLNKALTSPLQRGGPSLATVMVQQLIITPQEMSRLRRLTKRVEAIQDAASQSFPKEELIESPDFLTDLATRIVGARLGARLAEGSGSGAGIVLAGAGSRGAKTLAEKIPSTRIMDVLTEAAKDPQLMAKLLEKPRTPAARAKLEGQINIFLLQAGIIPEEE